jgi:hypothetical protein
MCRPSFFHKSFIGTPNARDMWKLLSNNGISLTGNVYYRMPGLPRRCWRLDCVSWIWSFIRALSAGMFVECRCRCLGPFGLQGCVWGRLNIYMILSPAHIGSLPIHLLRGQSRKEGGSARLDLLDLAAAKLLSDQASIYLLLDPWFAFGHATECKTQILKLSKFFLSWWLGYTLWPRLSHTAEREHETSWTSPALPQ